MKPTPATRNTVSLDPADVRDPPPSVLVNEWMAKNGDFLDDPADGNSEDWFELFNAGTNTANLSGFFLSDKPSQPLYWRIPDGTMIGPGGFLLVWADDEPEQNSPTRLDLHANFKLGAEGDSIALSDSEGRIVDFVRFGPQQQNVAQGRFPDGANALFSMSNPIPRESNGPGAPNPNTPPFFTFPGGILTHIAWWAKFSVPIKAEDWDVPKQTLTYSLLPPHPLGARIDPATGLFSWVPTPDLQVGSYLISLRVVDDGNPPLQADGIFSVRVAGPPKVAIRHLPNPPAIEFTFQAVPGLVYRAYCTSQLAELDTWTQLGADISVSSLMGIRIQDLILTNSQRFYPIDLVDPAGLDP